MTEKLSVANLTLPSASAAPRVPVHVECVLKPEAAISREDIHNLRLSVGSLIVRSSAREDGATMIRNGEFTIPPEDVALSACARVRVVDVEEPSGVVAVSAELSIDCYFEDDNLPECEYVSEGGVQRVGAAIHAARRRLGIADLRDSREAPLARLHDDGHAVLGRGR
jgi:hypothetical protein